MSLGLLSSVGFLGACAIGAAAALALACLASALPRLRVSTRRTVLLAGVGAALLVPGVEATAGALEWGVLPALAPPHDARPAPAPLPRSGLAPPRDAVSAAAGEGVGTEPLPRAATPVDERRSGSRFGAAHALVVAWALGAAIGLLRLGAGIAAAVRLRRSLRPVVDPRTVRASAEAATRLGRPSLDVFEGDAIGSPATVGFLRPVVVLPVRLAAGLDDADLLAVLLHEGAHVARRDPLAGLLARLLRAVHWFDPFAHVAAARLHDASEELADAAVVSTPGVAARRYATCLVRLGEAARRDDLHAALTCLGGRRGALERRVEALLAPAAARGARPSWRGRALAAATAGVVASALLVLRPGPVTAGGDAAAEERPGLTYRGRVLDAGGKPLAGASVYVVHGPPPQVMDTSALLPWRPFAVSLPAEPVGGSDIDPAKEPTGQDGRFSVAGVEPPAGGFVVVVHASFRPARVVADPVALRDGVLDVGDVALERGGALRAKVLGPDGRPVAGAWVVAQPSRMSFERYSPGEIRSTRTVDDGTATIEGLRDTAYVAAAFTDTAPPVERPFEVSRGSARDETFPLREGATLRVLVADRRTGAPLGGARVDLEPKPPEGPRVVEIGAPPLATARTGEDGIASFPGLAEGDYVATAVPPDRAGDAVHHPPPFSASATARAGSEARILLDPPLRFPVVAMTADAEDLVDAPRLLVLATADWRTYDRTGGSPVDVRAWLERMDDDGFVLDGVRAGPWRFVVWAPGHLPWRSGVVTIAPPTRPLEVVLEPAVASASGRVVSRRDRRAIAGAEVASYEWIESLGDGQRATATTSADGAFRLAPLLGPGYPLRLEVTAPGFLPLVVERDATRREESLGGLDLVRAASVAGRVLDAGRPVAGVLVTLAPRDGDPHVKGGGVDTRTTDADGRFAFPAVAPGRYRLEAPGARVADLGVEEGADVVSDLVVPPAPR